MKKVKMAGLKKVFLSIWILCHIEIFSSCKQEGFFDDSGSADTTPWYGLVQTGYAYSFDAAIANPDPKFWDVAKQGYNAHLGGSPFLAVGFGRSLLYYLRLDVAYTYFQGFHYQKFQTITQSPSESLGSNQIRYFDLDHQNVMFNFSLYPEKYAKFSVAKLEISPYMGMGIGAGFFRMMNFHTVAYSGGVGSTTSIGTKKNTAAFAWQGFAGIRLQPEKSCMNIDLGYRYYHGGKFIGPDFIYVNNKALEGRAISGAPWKGKLRANEWTFSFNFWF